MIDRVSLRTLRYVIWVGLGGMFLLFGSGYVLSGFVLPPAPGLSSEEIVTVYNQGQTTIRIGCVLMIAGFCCVALWGCALAALTRGTEGRYPVLTYVQLACISVVTFIVIFVPMLWSVAAYRAGEIQPDVTKSINDLAWFTFLYPWPPLMIWLGATGTAILTDRAPVPTFPRWSAYLCFWTALLSVPGGMVSFFKSGPFAWNGLFAYWIPLAVFFVWVVGMTSVMVRALARLDGAIPVAQPEPVRPAVA